MEWTVVFDPHREAAIVTTRGTFSEADNARMVEDIVGRPEWRPGHRILFDHRALDFGDAGYEQMFAAGRNHRENDERIGAARSALLMNSLASFGVGRQFQQIVDGVSAKLEIFVDENKAWHWLLKEPPVR